MNALHLPVSRRDPTHAVGGYREYPPPPDLAAALEAVWVHAEPRDADPSGHGHRVVPDPAVSLCFTSLRDARGRPEHAVLHLLGPVRAVRGFAPCPGRTLEALRVKPEWTRHLLDVVAAEHDDVIADYAAIRPTAGLPLFDALLATRTSAAAIACLLAFARSRLAAAPAAPAPLVVAGMEAIRAHAGAVRLGRLAACLGVSDRHLRRVLGDAVGQGPRAFARVQRLHQALRLTDHEARPRWAALAGALGYADQAHLIRDVRALTGVPPLTLHRERRAERGAGTPP